MTRAVPDDITYLVQAAPSLRRAKEAIPTHTYDQRAAFTPRLGLNYMIVRAVDVLGRVSDPAEIQVIHGSPASRVVGRRTAAIPTIHTAGSSNGRTLLLSDYVALHTAKMRQRARRGKRLKLIFSQQRTLLSQKEADPGKKLTFLPKFPGRSRYLSGSGGMVFVRYG